MHAPVFKLSSRACFQGIGPGLRAFEASSFCPQAFRPPPTLWSPPASAAGNPSLPVPVSDCLPVAWVRGIFPRLRPSQAVFPRLRAFNRQSGMRRQSLYGRFPPLSKYGHDIAAAQRENGSPGILDVPERPAPAIRVRQVDSDYLPTFIEHGHTERP